jgi:hypothetical protein
VGAGDAGSSGIDDGGERGSGGVNPSGGADAGGRSGAGDGGVGGAGEGGSRENAAGNGGTGSDDFGSISGDVGLIDRDELLSPAPSFLESIFDVGGAEFDEDRLSPSGQRLYDAAPAGGSSRASEAVAFEVLRQGAGATLLQTEQEVRYDSSGAKVDFVAEIDSERVGVSVVRGLTFPRETTLSTEAAFTLLHEKLRQLQDASLVVASTDAWVATILVVVAYDEQKRDAVRTAYEQLDAITRGNTVVLIVQTDGNDEMIY